MSTWYHFNASFTDMKAYMYTCDVNSFGSSSACRCAVWEQQEEEEEEDEGEEEFSYEPFRHVCCPELLHFLRLHILSLSPWLVMMSLTIEATVVLVTLFYWENIPYSCNKEQACIEIIIN